MSTNRFLSRYRSEHGFTIVELIVTITIISLLAAVVTVSVGQARSQARDKQRIAEIEQIALALEVYKQVYGTYPREADGANGIVGEGADVDDLVAPFMQRVPHDPLGPGNDDYRYYYDGDHSCGGQSDQAVIAAIEMEGSNKGNEDDTICSSWAGTGGIGSSNSYNVVLGPSDG